MKTMVALLRGINVGGNNKIEMSRLKECFESLGYSNVTTYINSGNVIFQTKKDNTESLAIDIREKIKKVFDLDIPVLIRRQDNIEKICQEIPAGWLNDKKNKTDVMFLWNEFANKNILKEIESNPKVDSLIYIDGAIVWHLRKEHYNKSKINDIIGTEIYKNMTVRNINTVRKLEVLMREI